MKPLANPVRLIIVYDDGSKYHVPVKVDSKEWAKVVPFIYNSGKWELKINIFQKIKYKIQSIISL